MKIKDRVNVECAFKTQGDDLSLKKLYYKGFIGGVLR
jgi:hypothetical protein